MVVVMAPEATQADVDAVVQLVHAAGGTPPSRGPGRCGGSATGGPRRTRPAPLSDGLMSG